MACDGRLLNRADPRYAALFDAIAFFWGGDLRERFHVRDLRGYFLRGVDARRDGRDPGEEYRTEDNPSSHRGRAVGSGQGWGTALPPVPHDARLSPAGRHHHVLLD